VGARCPAGPIPAKQVEAERAVIRECYRRILAGKPLMHVVADLEQRGITGLNGVAWTTTTLGKSLYRPVLASLVVHNGTITATLADTKPVVSREQ
jgi:site-specific DNA recombinase